MIKKILNQLEQEYQQWFLWTPVWLGLGIGFYFLGFHKIEFFYFFFVLFLSCLFVKKEKNGYQYFLFMGSFICIGVIVADFRTKNLHIQMITKPKNNCVIEGILENIEDHPRQSHMSRWTIDQSRLTILNSLSQKATLGDRVKIKADLLPFSQPLTQGSFDWRRHYFFKKIKATGRIKKILSVHKKNPSFLPKIRYLVGQHLKKNLSKTTSPIAKSLTTGDTSGISHEIRQNFANAGIAHILAISGLHMSIVTGLIFMATRRFLALFPFLALRYSIKFFAFLIAIAASFFYMLISGMGFPVIRSFCMGIFLMVGLINGRHPISIRSVSIGASLILLFYPEALLSISFQLSFAAVLVLIGCHRAIPIQNRFLNYFCTMVLTTFLATLATFPFTIVAFQKITLQAITGNLLAVPLTTFWIIPSLLLSFIFPFFFKILEKGIDFLIDIASYVSQLPGSNLTFAQPNGYFLPTISFCMMWFLLWKQRWRYMGLYAIVFCVYVSYIGVETPDIMMGHSTLAYHKDGVLYVSHPKKGKFEFETWMRVWNIQKVQKWSSYPAFFKGYTLIGQKKDTAKAQGHLYLRSDHETNCFVWGKTIRCVTQTKSPWNP